MKRLIDLSPTVTMFYECESNKHLMEVTLPVSEWHVSMSEDSIESYLVEGWGERGGCLYHPGNNLKLIGHIWSHK